MRILKNGEEIYHGPLNSTAMLLAFSCFFEKCSLKIDWEVDDVTPTEQARINRHMARDTDSVELFDN